MKIVTADITGSLIVNNVDVTQVTVSSSIWSGSISQRVTNLENWSSSLDATFATDASVSASILVLSQSVQASEAALSSSYTATSGSYVTTSGSYAAASASLSTRVTNVEATASINTQASASFAAYSASVSVRLTTDETNITTLTNASASFAAQSASLSTRLTTDESNFNTTSGSISGRVTLIEGQYATTGSNNFTNIQYISATTNAASFTTSASLYTDGGLRVLKDSFISGTAYFNNVVVYGTSSIQYITSSQVNVGSNIINLNTQTPAVRFGGMAVADSGSNAGITGSMLWDSIYNRWIYSNPSGSTYDGGMIISGPRNTTGLGNELGTTACYLMAGQGGDHITSSAVYTDTNATCFYGNAAYVSSSGTAYFAGCVGIQSTTPCANLQVNSGGNYIWSTGNGYGDFYVGNGTYGLSMGTAVGGGGAGDTRMWTKGGTHTFYIGTSNVDAVKVDASQNVCVAGNLYGCSSILANNNIRVSTGTSAGNATDPAITTGGCTKAGIYFAGSCVALGSGGNMLLLTQCGRVGIGTATPDYGNLSIFSIDNTALSSAVWGTSTAGGVVATAYNGSQCVGSVAGLRLITRNSGASIWNIYNVSTGASTGDLVFGNGSGGTGYEKLRITDNGLACFACTVCVGGEMIVKGNAGTYNTHYFTTGASNVAKYIQYNASGTAINQIAADNVSYFNSGCNFGIGTIPEQLFDITSNTDTTIAQVKAYKSAYGNVRFQLSTFAGGSTSTDRFSIQNDSGTKYFNVIWNGNIGINNTTPCGKLQISLSTVTGGCFRTSSGGEAALTIEACGNSYLQFMNRSTSQTGLMFGNECREYSGMIWYRHDAKQLMLGAGGTETMYVCGGNVGIGNTTPGAPLEINSSGGLSGFTGFKLKYGTSSVQSLTMGQVTAGNGAWIGMSQYRLSGYWQTEGTAAAVLTFGSDGAFAINTNCGLTANSDYNLSQRLLITQIGIACFACRTCSPALTTQNIRLSDEATFGATWCKGAGGYPFMFADGGQSLGFGNSEAASPTNERLRIFQTGIACFACKPSFPGASLICTYTCTYSSYTAGCWLGLFAGDNGMNGAYAFTVVGQFNLGGSGLYSMNYSTMPYIHKSDSIGSTNGNDFYWLPSSNSGHADNGALTCFRRARYSGNTPVGNRTEFCMNVSYSNSFTATTYVLAWV